MRLGDPEELEDRELEDLERLEAEEELEPLEELEPELRSDRERERGPYCGDRSESSDC
jgi:hypothetical protein